MNELRLRAALFHHSINTPKVIPEVQMGLEHIQFNSLFTDTETLSP